VSKLSLKLIRISTQKQSEVRQQGGKVVQSSDCRQLGTLSFTFLSLKNLSVLVSAVKPAKNRNYMKRKSALSGIFQRPFFENLTDQVQHVS